MACGRNLGDHLAKTILAATEGAPVTPASLCLNLLSTHMEADLASLLRLDLLGVA